MGEFGVMSDFADLQKRGQGFKKGHHRVPYPNISIKRQLEIQREAADPNTTILLQHEAAELKKEHNEYLKVFER